jgi:hypothetical protein
MSAAVIQTKRNPKQEGTVLYDCVPQIGPCPIGCNQCFYNRPGAFYLPIDRPSLPSTEEVGEGICRINCGNDSNNQREKVIDAALAYKNFFFNTSVMRLDFPGPVVLTVNPREEANFHHPPTDVPQNLMFVRVRTSATNLPLVDQAVKEWTSVQVAVVLTFMAYYDHEPLVSEDVQENFGQPCYEWRVRHINSYHCCTQSFMRWVLSRYTSNRLVSMCGSIASGYCKDCRNCETYYLQTMKRLNP